MDILSSVLLLLLLLLPLGVGLSLLFIEKSPSAHLAGFLTLVPFVNAIVTAFLTQYIANVPMSDPTWALRLLAPGAGPGLVAIAILDLRTASLRHWLWGSFACVVFQWLMFPLIWKLISYGVVHFYDTLDGVTTLQPISEAEFAASILFVVLPTVAALYNLFMVRRDIRLAAG